MSGQLKYSEPLASLTVFRELDVEFCDGSLFANLHGIIIQFNAYQSVQLLLITA